MLDMRVADVICGLVEQLLDRSPSSVKVDTNTRQYTRPGMQFEVDAHISSFEKDVEYQASERITIIVAGTSVWVARQGNRSRLVHLVEFINTSNHDSCWRSSGIDSPLTQLYFNLCEEVNRNRVADGKPERCPVSMHQHVRFAWSSVFKNVEVVSELDRDDPNHYHRRLVEVRNK